MVRLDKTLESPLDSKEIKSVNPKGNKPWLLIAGTAAEAEARILWPLDGKSRHTENDWCWERLKAKGGEDNRGWDGRMASSIQWTRTWVNSILEIVKDREAWHAPWGCKESDTTQSLNNSNNAWMKLFNNEKKFKKWKIKLKNPKWLYVHAYIYVHKNTKHARCLLLLFADPYSRQKTQGENSL